MTTLFKKLCLREPRLDGLLRSDDSPHELDTWRCELDDAQTLSAARIGRLAASKFADCSAAESLAIQFERLPIRGATLQALSPEIGPLLDCVAPSALLWSSARGSSCARVVASATLKVGDAGKDECAGRMRKQTLEVLESGGLLEEAGALGGYSVELRRVLEDDVGRLEFDAWARLRAGPWALSGRIALAALVEVAVRFGSSASLTLMLAALEEERSHVLAKAVSAQRARLVRELPPGVRKRLWFVLPAQIRAWESDPDGAAYARAALPSVLALAGPFAVPFVKERIAAANPAIATAAAHAVLDWASGVSTYPFALDARDADDLFALVERRVAELSCREASDMGVGHLLAALQWVVGALATEPMVGRAWAAVLPSLLERRSPESGGALRGARALVRRHGEMALASMRSACQAMPEPERIRIDKLVRAAR